MSEPALNFVTKVSRGTPRVANAALEWLRDVQISEGIASLSEGNVEDAMGMRGVDADGTTEMDRKYLEILKRSDQPLGIDSLSSISGFDRQTIEGIIEPWLLQNAKIMKTPKGRVAI